jgi:hypothetical protein
MTHGAGAHSGPRALQPAPPTVQWACGGLTARLAGPAARLAVLAWPRSVVLDWLAIDFAADMVNLDGHCLVIWLGADEWPSAREPPQQRNTNG